MCALALALPWGAPWGLWQCCLSSDNTAKDSGVWQTNVHGMAWHGIPCLASACALFWISPGLFVPNASCVRAVAIRMAWRTIRAMMRSCHHLCVNFKLPITVKGHRNSLPSLPCIQKKHMLAQVEAAAPRTKIQ